MSFFAASPFLTALGWALLNSLWQFAICWLIYRTLTASIKNLTAAARHSIALLLLFAGTAFFIAGLSWKYYADAASAPINHSKLVVENNYYYTIWHTADTTMDTIMPYWSLLYLGCVLFLFLKFCLFVRRASNLQNNGITKMNAVWRAYVKVVSSQLGIKKEVKALLSIHIDTPQVIGFFKPVILLPAACLTNLTPEQLEAVLLHELVHIKRNDYLVNLFVTSAEILFFFNPFVKQLTASIRKEREYSCDDMVIQFQYHPHNYASALLTLEKSRMLPVTYGIAAAGKNQQQLLTRIERIMGIQNRQTGFYRLGACLMTLLLLGFIATINPAKVAVDNFGPANLALAFIDNDVTADQYNNEAGKIIKNTIADTKPAITPGNKVNKEANAPHSSKAQNNQDKPQDFYTVSSSSEDDADEMTIETAAKKETIDFSLPQKKPITVPPPAIQPDETPVVEPYVPSSSFSFQVTQDTAMPKMKGETYSERMAKDALLKAQKAIEQINWQQIEKQLKFNRHDIAKLKNQLAIQMRSLNWQKINNDVKVQAGQEQLQIIVDAAKQNQALKFYQQNEAWQEAMKQQLSEQEQILKEADLRAKEAQKALEEKKLQIQREMKKKSIIYI